MQLTSLRACALALWVTGCASVPTLRGAPEDIGDQIGANAVAYNQGYGRAIADQVLLNILRARDRLPLYHLSMSGITEDSQLQQQLGQVTIGGISLGDGNGGIAQFVGDRTLTTHPTYTLNPFSSTDSAANAFQFRAIDPSIFLHFWEGDWPRDMLLYIMVDDIATGQAAPMENTGTRLDRCQTDEQHRRSDDCGFYRAVLTLTDLRRVSAKAQLCNPTPTAPAPSTPLPPTGAKSEQSPAAPSRDSPDYCWIVLDVPPMPTGGQSAQTTYRLNLRSVDDMIYYVGSLLRTRNENQQAASAPLLVRPQGVYPTDEEGWPRIQRTANLFRVSVSPPPRSRGAFAAEARYGGVRYFAGPANSITCVECAPSDIQQDGSSRVLSLLTQLMIISQTERAQLGPRPVINTSD